MAPSADSFPAELSFVARRAFAARLFAFSDAAAMAVTSLRITGNRVLVGEDGVLRDVTDSDTQRGRGGARTCRERSLSF